jgi:RluA family pseudouridine synthase
VKPVAEIIFEDADIVVVNKPPHLLSIPDRFDPLLPNALEQLKQSHGSIFTVHRLDKPTSGVLLFARHEEAHRHLSEQFEKRKVRKYYLALIDGILFPPSGKIEKPIAPHPRLPDRMVVTAHGKTALTEYQAIEFFRDFTLAEVQIHTGRMHQIRVHFESIGFPLAVDELYGRRREIFFTDIKRTRVSIGKFDEPRPLMNRTSLHSNRLIIQHPMTGAEMEFKADLPKDFKALLQQLRRWGQAATH